MGDLNDEVFNGKSFSSILEEIYKNQKSKQKQIIELIKELKPLVQDIGDATLIVPLIKDYMELGIKNDEQLIKMSTIIQRVINNSSSDSNDLGMTEEEKEQLLKEVENISSKNDK